MMMMENASGRDRCAPSEEPSIDCVVYLQETRPSAKEFGSSGKDLPVS